jgi:hypothetical protein
MADSLHAVVRQVRDTYLEGLTGTVNTLFATLESKIRDTLGTAATVSSSVDTSNFASKQELNDLREVIENEVLPMLNGIVPQLNTLIPTFVNYKNDMSSLKNMYEDLSKSVKEYKSFVDSSEKNTVVHIGHKDVSKTNEKPMLKRRDELTAVVHDGMTVHYDKDNNPYRLIVGDIYEKMEFDKETEEFCRKVEEEVEKTKRENEKQVEEENDGEETKTQSEPVETEGETKFTPLEVGDMVYWLDDDHVVYKETEEGFEAIGSYDPESGELSLEEEDEEAEEETEQEEVEAEEEDEEEELEEFEYKGKTYYRDTDNMVYNDQLEQVGFWTGSKLVVKKS